MILKSWKIETDWTGTRRWFWVRVYDSLPALRKSAANYSGGIEGVGHFANAIACVQRTAVIFAVEDTEECNPIWPGDGLAGVVRLEENSLYTSVIYHELVHAAAIVYRMNLHPTINLGDGRHDLNDEESFAYIYGELAADMDTGLRKHMDFGNWGAVS